MNVQPMYIVAGIVASDKAGLWYSIIALFYMLLCTHWYIYLSKCFTSI